jgi:hypothetical protein
MHTLYPFSLVSCILSKTGVTCNSLAISVFVLWSVHVHPAVRLKAVTDVTNSPDCNRIQHCWLKQQCGGARSNKQPWTAAGVRLALRLLPEQPNSLTVSTFWPALADPNTLQLLSVLYIYVCKPWTVNDAVATSSTYSDVTTATYVL